MSSIFSFLRFRKPVNIINVKDYGATGDGVTDDTQAIQTAFNIAFGPTGTPHGNARKFDNKPVYFPGGIYRITATLTITQVFGGWIFGDGMDSTQLLWDGGSVSSSPFSTILLTKFMAYSHIEGMTFNHPSNDGNMVCIYQFKDDVLANNAGNANTYENLRFKGAADGILIGFGCTDLGSENLFLNCSIEDCFWGVRIAGNANALDQVLLGGVIKNCSSGVSTPTGSVICVLGTRFEGNSVLDINQTGGDCLAILGAHTTSQNFASTGGPLYLCGIKHENASAGSFVDSTAGFDHVVVDGSHSTNGKFISASGSLYKRGSTFDSANALTSFSGTLVENI